MEKTLSQKIKRSARGLAVAGLVGLAGCGTEEEMRQRIEKKAYADSVFMAGLAKGDSLRDSLRKVASARKDSLDKVKAAMDSARMDSTYSFYNFGGKYAIRKYASDAVAMVTGDYDGDGDMDIAILDAGGILHIYQNKIPQKLLKPYSSEKEALGVKK